MEKQKEIQGGLLFLGAFLVAATALFTFGWLAEEMLEGDTQRFDAFVRDGIHRHASPGLTRLMLGFSFLGSVATISVLCVLVLCVFFYYRRTRLAALVGITMVGVVALDVVLKLAFHRLRPVTFFGPTPSSYSFPSGHALGSFCFFGVLAAIFSARARGRIAKWCMWTGAVLLVGMIGFSRIYLGVHFPSDVIAGYCAGAVWVVAVVLVARFLWPEVRK